MAVSGNPGGDPAARPARVRAAGSRPREIDAPLEQAATHARRGAEDRREGSRRPWGGSNSGSALSDTVKQLIVPEWQFFAPVLALAVAAVSFSTGSLPGFTALSSIIVATALCGLAPFFSRLDQKWAGCEWRRYAAIFAGVGMPAALTGIGFSFWHQSQPDFPAQTLIAALLLFGLIAAGLLNGRLQAVMIANIAMWTASCIVLEEFHGLIAVMLAVSVAIVLSLRQRVLDGVEEAHRRELERIQRRADELLREYEKTGQGWFWETDRRGAITYVSPAVAKSLGCSSKSLAGQHFTNLFVLDAGDQDGERTLPFHLSARSSFNDLAVRARTEEERWWSISGRPIHDEFNNFVGFRGSGSDLTEKRRSQENATRLAHYDSLTGLANRFQMSVTLEKILTAQRDEQRICAVFLLDLDRFKQVNDTLGHPAGDALLKQVAERLTRTVGDEGMVGRLGGDEFQVVLPGLRQRDTLAELARAIIENLSQPYSIEGHRVVIGASVGIAIAPADGDNSEAMIRNCDLALYAAKDGGRGRYHFYDPELHSEAEERRQLEQDLRDAISTGGLEMHYQPVVHTMTEKITGFEALLRWNHPRQGHLSPAKFIPIAEDAGLINLIGEWALRTACKDLANWPEKVRVAVNVSPLQFSNPSLPAIVTSAIASAQIDPSRLELEITESVFLDDDKSTEAMFAALKRVGVRLALDDFGTGYSSLGYLKKAPFDKIKIDQSFVRGATVAGSRNGALIASIVSLAEALDMETTAEGVETFDELDLVRELGCSHVQGFIYEKPLTSKAATQRLVDGLEAIASGPRSARAARHKMLRKVELEHNGEKYQGTIRNISSTGAMIEGLWNVPPGTIFAIEIDKGVIATATSRWCNEDRMGVEFATPIARADYGGTAGTNHTASGRTETPILRREAG